MIEIGISIEPWVLLIFALVIAAYEIRSRVTFAYGLFDLLLGLVYQCTLLRVHLALIPAVGFIFRHRGWWVVWSDILAIDLDGWTTIHDLDFFDIVVRLDDPSGWQIPLLLTSSSLGSCTCLANWLIARLTLVLALGCRFSLILDPYLLLSSTIV